MTDFKDTAQIIGSFMRMVVPGPITESFVIRALHRYAEYLVSLDEEGLSAMQSAFSPHQLRRVAESWIQYTNTIFGGWA